MKLISDRFFSAYSKFKLLRMTITVRLYSSEITTLFFLLCQRIFKESMLLQFVNVFLQALVFRSHDLLQEEITITLYNMAAVDFDSFYSAFLPQFLGGCEGLTDSQKTELGNNFTPDKVGTTKGYKQTQ